MTIGPYAAEEIKLGRLVQPFPLRVPHKHNWYFAAQRPTATRTRSRDSKTGW